MRKMAMGLWLVVVLFLILVIGVFVWIRLQGNVRLLSLRTDLKWQVNRQELIEVYDKVGGNDRIAWIVLMPGLEKHKQAVGVDIDRKPVYYSEWRVINGQTVLAVFVDIDEWKRLKPEQRDQALSLFMADQMGKKFGKSAEQKRAGTGIVIRQDKQMIGIIKRFNILR